MAVKKAKLMRVMLPGKKGDKAKPISGTEIDVQFNPETLTVTYSNQIAGNKQKGSSTQLAASGTSKLSLDLWFDTTMTEGSGQSEQSDVRLLTRKVAAMMEPPEQQAKGAAAAELPAVRFHWGSFIFDGVMDSLTEKLEYFSAEGIPLRASLSVSLSAQSLLIRPEASGGAGTQEHQTPPSGEPLAQMAAKQGIDDWKSIAEANGIENARLMPEGQKIVIRKEG